MSAVTIRCPCGTYIRATEVQAGHVVDVVRMWLNAHGPLCTAMSSKEK